MTKRVYAALFAVLLFAGFAAGISAQSGGTSEIIIQRAASRINQGFRERIYIDGRQQLTLANGSSGKIVVPRGEHTIHAELSTLTTDRIQFTAGSSPVTFVITPYSLDNFVIERSGGPQVPAGRLPEGSGAAGNALQAMDDPADTSVEASLDRAANAIMTRVPPRSKMAIVYVTARDLEISEFIAGELEFIMVEKGFILIDRSQLDRIRSGQPDPYVPDFPFCLLS
jgi:hypothetical protein